MAGSTANDQRATPPAAGPALPDSGRRRRDSHVPGEIEPERTAGAATKILIGALTVAGVAAMFWAWRYPDRPGLSTLAVGAFIVALTARTPTATVVLPARRGSSPGAEWAPESASVNFAVVAFDPFTAVLVAAAATLIQQIVRRRSWQKLVFNVGQHTFAVAVGAAVLQRFRPETFMLDTVGVLVATATSLTYDGITLVCVLILMSTLTGQSLADAWKLSVPANVLVGVGANIAVGALGGLLWRTAPAALPLVFIPLLFLRGIYTSAGVSARRATVAQADLERLNRTVSGVHDGVVLLEPDGKIVVYSPAMAELAGVPEDVASGQDIRAVLQYRGRDGSELDDLLRHTHPTQPTWVEAGDLAGTDGATPVAVQVTSHYDDGNLTETALVFRDLTLELEMGRLKDEFFDQVTHDLRTPLVPIVSYAQLLHDYRSSLNDEEVDHALAAMVDRATHLTRLVDDLLLSARIADGEAALSDQVSLGPVLLEDAVRVAIEDVELGGVDHRFVRHDRCHGTTYMTGDPHRVRQVLTNLLTNACKYSPAGNVEVTTSCDETQVHISVTDHGVGIPEAEQQLIFDRFYRAEGASVNAGGTGVGLYVVNHLVEAMGGQVEVESAPDVGSTFTVTFTRHHPGS